MNCAGKRKIAVEPHKIPEMPRPKNKSCPHRRKFFSASFTRKNFRFRKILIKDTREIAKNHATKIE